MTKTTAGGSSQTLTGTGVQDPRTDRGRIEFDLSGLTGARRLGDRARLEEVFDGLVFYVSSPLFAGQLPAGKTWSRVDVAELPPSANTDIDALLGVHQTSPGDALEYLRAIGDVREKGREPVRGVPTTRYSGTISLRKAADQVSPSRRSAAKRSVEKLVKATGRDGQHADVWIDGEKHVRRVHTNYTIKYKGGSEQSVDTTIDYFGFGAGSVRLPPSTQVQDLTGFMKRKLAAGTP